MFAGEAIADILSRPEEISMDFAVIVGTARRSVLLYVRTRGADETDERREINPAARPPPPRGY
jgi:hypothetical protein